MTNDCSILFKKLTFFCTYARNSTVEFIETSLTNYVTYLPIKTNLKKLSQLELDPTATNLKWYLLFL